MNTTTTAKTIVFLAYFTDATGRRCQCMTLASDRADALVQFGARLAGATRIRITSDIPGFPG
jgi:hypothetical protein